MNKNTQNSSTTAPQSQPLKSRHMTLVFGSAFSAALLLFITIPLVQMVAEVVIPTEIVEPPKSVVIAPPIQDFIDPPPAEEEQAKEDIDIEKRPERLDIHQIEFIVNPSTGGFGIGYSVGIEINPDQLGTTDAIINIDDVDEKPTVTRQIMPIYPPSLRRDGISGRVDLVIIVDENGNVVAPRVERSTRVEFERPALDAIRRWKFTPGRQNGQAVKVRVRVPLLFSVN